MRSMFVRVAAFLLVLAFVCTPVWATCGGGGGGGGGGMSGGGNSNGGGNDPVVYHVPWKTPAVAKAKATAGEKDAAIAAYQAVAAEKCMFPKKAKTATAELKKLGANNIGAIADSPNFDPKVSASIVRTMKQGLIAENAAKYDVADKLYAQAHKMDLADPTPLRYLAELHRHHIGDWEKAKVEFHQLLDMQNADPLSRAVALHGLGKITIHEGEFKKGLHLMEESVATYPIALAYRNLAVYWNSEYDIAKGTYYTEQALAMDPKDPYNLIFSAVFLAMNGKKQEALKIAEANINLL